LLSARAGSRVATAAGAADGGGPTRSAGGGGETDATLVSLARWMSHAESTTIMTPASTAALM
jgi:hypothetical protein